MGVLFEDRTWVCGVEYPARLGGAALGGVKIHTKRFAQRLHMDEKFTILAGRNDAIQVDSSPVQYEVKQVVNCAGPWAMSVAKVLGYDCPSYPLRRQVCIFDCKELDMTPYGMIVDSSGVYFHPEASNGLAGFADPNESRGVNYHYDGENFFIEKIWPALYNRATVFERLKHLTGWAGLYEVSPDISAIIGRVEWGDAGKNGRIFEAHSFSGHGVMQSYAAGLALAERMVNGRYDCLEGDLFSGMRFHSGHLLNEGLAI